MPYKQFNDATPQHEKDVALQEYRAAHMASPHPTFGTCDIDQAKFGYPLEPCMTCEEVAFNPPPNWPGEILDPTESRFYKVSRRTYRRSKADPSVWETRPSFVPMWDIDGDWSEDPVKYQQWLADPSISKQPHPVTGEPFPYGSMIGGSRSVDTRQPQQFTTVMAPGKPSVAPKGKAKVSQALEVAPMAEQMTLYKTDDHETTRKLSPLDTNAKNRRPKEGERMIRGKQLGGRFIPDSPLELMDLVSDNMSAYQVTKDLARSAGVTLRYAPTAKRSIGGHEWLVYRKPQEVPGINYPAGFKVMSDIGLGELNTALGKINEGYFQLCQTVLDRCSTSDPTDEAVEIELRGTSYRVRKPEDPTNGDDPKYLSRLRSSVVGRLTRMTADIDLEKNAILPAAGRHYSKMTEGTEREATDRSIALDGVRPVGKRWVPRLDWFDPRLSEITDEQLLPLLEPAERETMMMILGRGVLGRQGTKLMTKDGEIVQERLWRLYAIWEGRKGGLGRTTTLGYLEKGFNYLGYNAGTIDPPVGRFGHGQSSERDFGYIDDLDIPTTSAVMRDGTFKTVVSGGTLRVEEKGEKAYTATAGGVYMMCTNMIDPAGITKLDDGNRARVAAMRNRTGSDKSSRAFEERYGYGVAVDSGYEHLARKYGCTILTLTLLLLARSAELFRGYAEEDTSARMVNHLKSLRKDFRVDIDQNYCDGILQSYAMLLQHADRETTGPNHFDIRDYLRLLDTYCEQSDTPMNPIPGCQDSKSELKKYCTEARKNGKGSKAATQVFFSMLISGKGFGYPEDTSYWSDRWVEFRDSYDWESWFDATSDLHLRDSELPADRVSIKKLMAALRLAQ